MYNVYLKTFVSKKKKKSNTSLFKINIIFFLNKEKIDLGEAWSNMR